MKLEAFGFTPVVGTEYVVNFSANGEPISSTVYSGGDLPAMVFPDNSVINLTIMDKNTGKILQASEYVHYNGKLVKSVFNIPLKERDSNVNQNVEIKDLHYDLTTGSILVQVQGFVDEQYTLKVNDVTAKVLSGTMPIVVKDDTYYSIPTTLVQGNTFEVSLVDAYDNALDAREFTAPISTDWRYDGTFTSAPQEVVGEVNTETGQNGFGESTTEEGSVDGEFTSEEITDEESSVDGFGNIGGMPVGIIEEEPSSGFSFKDYVNPYTIGGLAIFLLLVIVLVLRSRSQNKATQNAFAYDGDPDEEELEDVFSQPPSRGRDIEEDEDDVFQEVASSSKKQD